MQAMATRPMQRWGMECDVNRERAATAPASTRVAIRQVQVVDEKCLIDKCMNMTVIW